MIYIIICIQLILATILASMSIIIDTRKCTESQLGGSDEEFAYRLKNYVENSPQPEGYCIMNNPEYPIQNEYECGSGRSIGWLWNFQFNDSVDSNYKIDFATDFGLGSAIFVDGQFVQAHQQDMWWNHDWESEAVFHLNYNFTAGSHEILVVGQEECCDGDMIVRFSRNEQTPQELTEENLDCSQTNNCQGVVCTDQQWQNGPDCVNCSNKCETCVDNLTCRTCSHNTRINPPSCNCKPGYYNVSSQKNCEQCKQSCKTCENGQQCKSCQEGWFLKQDKSECVSCKIQYGNKCGKCNYDQCLTCDINEELYLPDCSDTNCQSNQFLVGKTCQQCHNSCQTCSDYDQCTSCQDNEYLQNGSCKSCQETYGDHCGTCDSNQCLSCKNNSNFKLPDCLDISCQQSQTEFQNVCYDCEQKCQECSDTDTCTQCISGTYLKNDNCYDCIPPCLQCSDEQLCLVCDKLNYDINSGCQNCLQGYFQNQQNLCLSCQTYYGNNCGKCDQNECLECNNNSNFYLPLCEEEKCPYQTFLDNKICRKCQDSCQTCSNQNSCDSCQDLNYLENGQCKSCQYPCFLCLSATQCIVCQEIGRQAPNCDNCQENWFMNSETQKCVQICDDGYYGERNNNVCQKCDQKCLTCSETKFTCTTCPFSYVLYKGNCVVCSDIKGMQQIVGQQQGTCEEICGDGIRLNNDNTLCDDGNLIDGDGCDSKCKVEDGWVCNGGDLENKDNCQDKNPIKFSVNCDSKGQFLNVEKQAFINCVLKFNKKFELPFGKLLKDYVVLSIEGKNTDGFLINVSEIMQNNNRRNLIQNNNNSGIEYKLDIQPVLTLKNRKMVIDLQPKSAFVDKYGNNLESNDNNEQNTIEIDEYYYYTEDERKNTSTFEFWLQIGIGCVMFFLPFYVFIYNNHFNRFYILFSVIDIIQILYFYRFINIRWPINGIKFFQKLRPVISFYMWNFYKQEIPEDEFEQYSSGVKKFDSEREDALFLNNAGSMLSLLFIMIFMYLIVVFFSWKKLYKNTQNSKIYNLFFQLRYGYFEWGIWFDSILASSGVFIIYIFLQMTNINSKLNFAIAVFVGAFYFGFYVFVFVFIKKNKNNLYNKEINEEVEDIPLKTKLQKNNTFKLRNVWHFIEKVYEKPNKSFFYFAFIFRKIYIAIVLLTLQEHPKIQLCLFSFSHAAIILMVLKFKFFKKKKEIFKTCICELFVFAGVGCMYFLLDDEDENESFRLKYSWYVVGCLLMSLFIQGLFFINTEIIDPLAYIMFRKKKQLKITDLRVARKQGRQSVILDPQTLNSLQYQQQQQEVLSEITSNRSKEDKQLNNNNKNKKQSLQKFNLLEVFSQNETKNNSILTGGNKQIQSVGSKKSGSGSDQIINIDLMNSPHNNNINNNNENDYLTPQNKMIELNQKKQTFSGQRRRTSYMSNFSNQFQNQEKIEKNPENMLELNKQLSNKKRSSTYGGNSYKNIRKQVILRNIKDDSSSVYTNSRNGKRKMSKFALDTDVDTMTQQSEDNNINNNSQNYEKKQNQEKKSQFSIDEVSDM